MVFNVSIVVLGSLLLGAVYVIAWRRGYSAGDNPRRRRGD